MSSSWLIRNAEIRGRVADVRLRQGRIHAIEPALDPVAGETTLEANGGALLPGLQDHHIHLLALAAARRSVHCGPPRIRNRSALKTALQDAARALPEADGEREAWIRGVGYHESVAGDLGRHDLDEWIPDRPVRIQHRSGALWILNSRAIERLALDTPEQRPVGAEHDAHRRSTGRLYREDEWLRAKLGQPAIPDLASVGSALARVGVTAVCDATPSNGESELKLFERARQSGRLPQRLLLMGRLELPRSGTNQIERGAVKRMLDEARLPTEDELVEEIRAAHAAQRGVAFHCVTRSELVAALAALERAGANSLDRIEHASVTPPDLLKWLARLPVAVVTQPNFLFERGDAYRQDVEQRDQPWLYRCGGFVRAGVPLAAGTDAPFGEPDPWAAMRAAVDRRSSGGQDMGQSESLSPEAALDLFTSPLGAPGRGQLRVELGAAADLVLLDKPWLRARDQLDAAGVCATWVEGRQIWGPPAPAQAALETQP